MDILQKFMEESAAGLSQNVKASDLLEENSLPNVKIEESSEGSLIISGCMDWMNTLSNVVGLESPHLIKFNTPVRETFSSSSSFHLFVCLTNDDIYVMGKNENGQLGVGDRESRELPVKVIWPGIKVKKISTGRFHSLMLSESGDVYVCGANNCGQCGMGENVKDILLPILLDIKEIVVDIACGWNHSLVCTSSGALYAFGHPEYGQLGFGTEGKRLKDGGKGPALQYNFICTPRRVQQFYTKDRRGNTTSVVAAADIKVRLVAAGKNHSICVEDWESGEKSASDGDGSTIEPKIVRGSRVFSWGFGGYGRLGHNSASDELFPRQILQFQELSGDRNNKQIAKIYCGSTYSIALTKSKRLFFFGKLPNSPRGEAQLYPKHQEELFQWPVENVGAGSSFVVVSSSNVCIFWGVPVAGKFGLEGDVRQSVAPKFVEKVDGFIARDISCGYGHCCAVLTIPVPVPGLGESDISTDNGKADVPSIEQSLSAQLGRFPVIEVIAESDQMLKRKGRGAAKSEENETNKINKKAKKK